MADLILYKALDGERPAIVLDYEPARGPYGTIDVRDMKTLELVSLAAEPSPSTWRFRD